MIQQESSPPLNLPLVFTSSRAEETFALGECCALLLEKGSVVAIRGPLGAGKTCLTKGIAKALGIEEEVTSPTYTIVSEYEGVLRGQKEKVPVYHIDAYRLRGDDDFTAIGGEDIVFGNGISIVEWSERISAFIPNGALRVDIEIMADNKRIIRVYKDLKEDTQKGDCTGEKTRHDAALKSSPDTENRQLPGKGAK